MKSICLTSVIFKNIFPLEHLILRIKNFKSSKIKCNETYPILNKKI